MFFWASKIIIAHLEPQPQLRFWVPASVTASFGPQTVIASSVCCLHFRNFIGPLHVRQKEGKNHGKKISKEVLENSFIVSVQ
jgi:hypothetical protein